MLQDVRLTSSSSSRWWTVVAGAVGCALGAGVLVIYTFGVLASAMAAEFGWSRTVYANSLTCFLVLSGLGSLLLGPLIDRFGVRRPAAVLVSIFGMSIASLAWAAASPWAVYLIFGVIGLSGSAATAMPYAVAVRNQFDERRGLALGLINFGSGVGSALAPFCVKGLLGMAGWRGGFVTVGLAALVPVLGLLFLVSESASPRRAPGPDSGDSVWLAQLGRPTFWLIAIPIAGISIATFGALGSMVPFLKDRGLGAASIAAIMSAAGASSWMARPVAGYLLDRVFAPFVAAAMFVFGVCGLLLLSFAGSVATVVTAAILIGFCLGSEGDLLAFLVSRYYGPAVYSRVLGALWVIWAWGGGIGTFVAGATFGAAASYTPALVGFAALLALCTIIVCRLGPYEYPAAARVSRGLSSA
jgi:MFS family permease